VSCRSYCPPPSTATLSPYTTLFRSPSFFTAATTRRRVSGRPASGSFRIRETVAVETPARRATSFIVTKAHQLRMLDCNLSSPICTERFRSQKRGHSGPKVLTPSSSVPAWLALRAAVSQTITCGFYRTDQYPSLRLTFSWRRLLLPYM